MVIKAGSRFRSHLRIHQGEGKLQRSCSKLYRASPLYSLLPPLGEGERRVDPLPSRLFASITYPFARYDTTLGPDTLYITWGPNSAISIDFTLEPQRMVAIYWLLPEWNEYMSNVQLADFCEWIDAPDSIRIDGPQSILQLLDAIRPHCGRHFSSGWTCSTQRCL